jgi:hypothetical protein
MPAYQIHVLTNAAPGKEAEFNKWYNEIHVPEIVATPSFSSGQRFEIKSHNGQAPAHRFLAIYDVTPGLDAGAALADLVARGSDGRFTMTDAMAPDAAIQIVEVLGPQQK